MKITQIIELDRDDRLAINAVLNIIDKISNTTGMNRNNIYDYFFAKSAWNDSTGFHFDESVIQINDIRNLPN